MRNMKGLLMRIWKRQLIATAAVLAVSLIAVQTARADDLLIIANHSVKAESISQDEARDIFLGDSNSLGGSHVAPVVLQKGASQTAFLQMVGKSESAFEATWRKQVFTGKGSMPHACESEDALIAYVGATPGAVGYVSAGKSPAGVKVLKVK